MTVKILDQRLEETIQLEKGKAGLATTTHQNNSIVESGTVQA
jgi:hypothetical protein